MVKKSAGLLVYREKKRHSQDNYKSNDNKEDAGNYEVLLVHPGGPYFAKKDMHVWSIPKGEFDDSEKALDAAKREFEEETGFSLDGEFVELKPVRQASGKLVYAWAVEGDIDADKIESNTFKLEWPPKSGKYQEIPEVDKAGWFSFEKAKEKIINAQVSLLEELERKLNA